MHPRDIGRYSILAKHTPLRLRFSSIQKPIIRPARPKPCPRHAQQKKKFRKEPLKIYQGTRVINEFRMNNIIEWQVKKNQYC